MYIEQEPGEIVKEDFWYFDFNTGYIKKIRCESSSYHDVWYYPEQDVMLRKYTCLFDDPIECLKESSKYFTRIININE